LLPEPEDSASPEPAEIADLAARRSDHDRDERRLLTDAIDAAVEAFYEWAGDGRDVCLAVVAMYGDPYLGDVDRLQVGRSIPVEARFFSLTDAEPLHERLRRHLALETMRAASRDLFDHVSRGLTLAIA
jgi:hypothetical protein